MPKSEFSSLLIALKGKSDIPTDILEDFLYADQVVCLSPKNLKHPLSTGHSSKFADHSAVNWSDLLRKTRISELNFASAKGTPAQFEILFKAVESRLADKARITVGGFHLSAAQFQSLTQRFDDVTLIRCHLGRGWWKPNPSGCCDLLCFHACTAAAPPTLSPGQAAWPALNQMIFFGAGRSPDLLQRGIEPHESANRPETEAFVRHATQAFWGERLQSCSFTKVDSLDHLTALPVRLSMRDLQLDAPVTHGTFDWVLQHRHLTGLCMNWCPSVRLPWHRLGLLKRLRTLDVAGSPLDDEQLREIAPASHLRSMQAFYTNLTPASWPVVLKWPSLIQFWASMEMSGTEFPEKLPETTALKEFVALNARTEWFEKLLSRYADVKIVNM